MNIREIAGRRVVVSSHTITVVDDLWKTRGMIRNVDNLYSIQANKQFVYCQMLKESLERSDYMGHLKSILIVDDKLFFLCDDYSYDVSLSIDDNYYKTVNKFENSGVITVIHCKRVKRSIA